jgi:hypothetical protein
MFADNATYILSSRQELETLCAAIFHHMRHFRLLMHASTLDENGNHQMKSKTEAMFIPAHPMTQENINAATTDIVFGTQYVPFTQEFQYLGSRLTTNLKDVTAINNQLRQAKRQAAALSTFFQSTANTWSKRLIFLAIPMNTALYGAKSWTLNVELRQQISSFYHTTICRIIRINMYHVAEYQIKNKHIHNYFSVPDPIDIIQKCQFNLLGKFAHMDPTPSLASFSPPGLATLDALVDSTTHYETYLLRHFSIFSQIFQTTAPLIHGCPLHRTMNSGKHSGLNG